MGGGSNKSDSLQPGLPQLRGPPSFRARGENGDARGGFPVSYKELFVTLNCSRVLMTINLLHTFARTKGYPLRIRCNSKNETLKEVF